MTEGPTTELEELGLRNAAALGESTALTLRLLIAASTTAAASGTLLVDAPVQGAHGCARTGGGDLDDVVVIILDDRRSGTSDAPGAGSRAFCPACPCECKRRRSSRRSSAALPACPRSRERRRGPGQFEAFAVVAEDVTLEDRAAPLGLLKLSSCNAPDVIFEDDAAP